jgi:hypothetical protein
VQHQAGRAEDLREKRGQRLRHLAELREDEHLRVVVTGR